MAQTKSSTTAEKKPAAKKITKATAEKKPTKATAEKKPAAKKPAKAAAEKPAKPAAKKPAKAAAEKPAKPAAKKPAKAAAEKPAKPAAKKPAAKKTTRAVTEKKSTKATAEKKPAAKKATSAVAEKKPAAKKATSAVAEKKPAAKKSLPPPPPPAPVDGQQLRRDAARALAKSVAAAGLDKKADRIEIIDITEKVDYADYLVLMSGRSDRQVQAIAGGIEEVLKLQGHRPSSVEGVSQGHWVIVDYGDVIVHVFQEEARRYYDLDSLWLDARRVPFESAARASVPPPA